MILKSPTRKLRSSSAQSQEARMADLPQCASLKTKIIGGQSLTTTRAYFDRDDKNIIVASHGGVLYYSIETSKLIAQALLDPDKLNKGETFISSDMLDNSLFLFTNHGQVFIWNLETRDWSNQLALPVPVEEETLICCKLVSKRQYIYTTKNNQTKKVQLWYSMSRSEREKPKNRELVSQRAHADQNSFDIGCLNNSGTYTSSQSSSSSRSDRDKHSKQRCLAFLEGPYICFQKIGVGEKFMLSVARQRVSQNFTCIRANSQSPMVAAGDSLGRIYIYTGDFVAAKFNRTKLHWHSHSVNDLCFSSTGNTLYSVGPESGCLAVWDLSHIGQKYIIPRLGMPIRYVNCSNRLNQLILSFEDNEIQFMDTDGRTRELRTLTKRTMDIFSQNDVKALRRVDSTNKVPSVGLLWHSKTDTVVTNARTGWLQFFTPKDKSKHLALNFLKTKIETVEKEAKVTPSEITRAAFSLDGVWLALYETQESKGTFPEVKLHIWQRSSTTKRWAWIQTADRLHTSINIVDLKFSPDGQYLLSLNGDGDFQILHRVSLDVKSSSGASGKQMYAKGFVGNVPKNSASMATFSNDSSVMAVSLKNDTTLIWTIIDPFKLVYECQLSQVEATDIEVSDSRTHQGRSNEVLGLHFGHHRPTQSVAPLCEVRSKSIRIWNILNPQETMNFSATDLSQNGTTNEFVAAAFDYCSRDKDYFAVCTKSNQILLFNLSMDNESQKLRPLITFDATAPCIQTNGDKYYTNMCLLSSPILDIDSRCHSDPQILDLISRLCLMTNYQEIVAITDQLTLEREFSSNNCNAIKSVDKTELQAYFVKNASQYDEELSSNRDLPKTDHSTITEKQRKIRNRLEVQKMLKDLLIKIPSQNLPKMEILGPMILDKLT